ncbi:hypothetical protein F8S12_16390, partial [Nostoc sp. WHI]|nr:hypothetical protein [Nostoc sp. WHI]
SPAPCSPASWSESLYLLHQCTKPLAKVLFARGVKGKHRNRIINYEYHQVEQICSIGFGSVESAVLAFAISIVGI